MCQLCGLDCTALVEVLRVTPAAQRESRLLALAPAFANHTNLRARLVRRPISGNLWHADHILPVYAGGGQCDVDNIRTLCVCCHSGITAGQAAERARRRQQRRAASRQQDRERRAADRRVRTRRTRLAMARAREARLELKERLQRSKAQQEACLKNARHAEVAHKHARDAVS